MTVSGVPGGRQRLRGSSVPDDRGTTGGAPDSGDAGQPRESSAPDGQPRGPADGSPSAWTLFAFLTLLLGLLTAAIALKARGMGDFGAFPLAGAVVALLAGAYQATTSAQRYELSTLLRTTAGALPVAAAIGGTLWALLGSPAQDVTRHTTVEGARTKTLEPGTDMTFDVRPKPEHRTLQLRLEASAPDAPPCLSAGALEFSGSDIAPPEGAETQDLARVMEVRIPLAPHVNSLSFTATLRGVEPACRIVLHIASARFV